MTTELPETASDDAIKLFYLGALEERLAYLYLIRSLEHPVADQELLDLRTEIFLLDPESEALEIFYELRALLAFLDNQKNPRPLKQLLGQVDHVYVRMRQEPNHQRPHFHVEHKNEYSASYAVDTLERLAGEAPPRRIEKAILTWAAREQQNLLDIWKGLQAGENVRTLITGLSQV
jgi:Domain of unknown function (DUF4160)